MDKLEKVIKGLETIADNMPKIISWEYGDLLQNTVGTIECALSLIRQQQERIKELEATHTARVMTLEEVFCCKDPFYLEYGGGCIVCWAISCCHFQNSIHMTTQNGSHVELYNVKYGKSWRCWTQRPTDEQREAVKWE